MPRQESSFHRSVDGGRGCWLHRRHLAHREPGLPSPQPHPASRPALSQPASGQCNRLLWPIMPTTFRRWMVNWNDDNGGEGGTHICHDQQRGPPSRRLLLSKHDRVDPEWWTVSPRLLSSAWKKQPLLNWGAKTISKSNLISDQSFNPGPHWRWSNPVSGHWDIRSGSKWGETSCNL